MDNAFMTFLPWLEKRFGRFAVPNVTLMIIVGQVVTFLFAMSQQQGGGGATLLDNMQFVPKRVLDGEVWRLFTFIIYPPRTHPIWAFFLWYLFYLMGTSLESTWGTFRYNVFLLIGYLASVASAFLLPDQMAGNGFLYGTVFLAFARLFPDFILNLMLILPIKIKWLALLTWIGYALAFLRGSNIDRVMILAAIANYILFFWREHYRDLKDYHRRKTFQAKAAPKTKSGRMKHTCATCGLTSEDEPRTAFRYCSQCAGQACYCPAHIRNHEHVVERPVME